MLMYDDADVVASVDNHRDPSVRRSGDTARREDVREEESGAVPKLRRADRGARRAAEVARRAAEKDRDDQAGPAEGAESVAQGGDAIRGDAGPRRCRQRPFAPFEPAVLAPRCAQAGSSSSAFGV